MIIVITVILIIIADNNLEVRKQNIYMHLQGYNMYYNT
jgi:hypothetical protein